MEKPEKKNLTEIFLRHCRRFQTLCTKRARRADWCWDYQSRVAKQKRISMVAGATLEMIELMP